MRLLFLPCAAALALAPGAVAATLSLPAPSVWKLDPAASNSGEKGALSADNSLTVNAYGKGSMDIRVHYVGADGKAMDVAYNGATDGRPHRYLGGMGSFRDGVYTFEQADGTREYGTLTLSAEGKTLTNTYTVKPRVGASVQVVAVYTRVK